MTTDRQVWFGTLVQFIDVTYDVLLGRGPTLSEIVDDLDAALPDMDRAEITDRLRLVAKEEQS